MKRIRQKGFSLIEVLISIFILGALVGLFGAAIHLQWLIRDTKYEDIALRVADSKLNEYRALGYDSAVSGGSFADPLLSQLPGGEASSTISDFNATTKLITVTVSWRGAASSNRYQSLTTLLTQTGGL